MNKGCFIVIEGPDGSGKTTVCKLLAEKLKEEAKKSIGIHSISDEIQIKHLVRQIKLIEEQIEEIDKKIEEHSIHHHRPSNS